MSLSLKAPCQRQHEEEISLTTQHYRILDAPGALERLLMTLRKRRFELMDLESHKKEGYLTVTLTIKTNRSDKLNPLLFRLWDVRYGDEKLQEKIFAKESRA